VWQYCGGGCVVSFVFRTFGPRCVRDVAFARVSSLPHRRDVPLAPRSTASSGSQGWGRVLGCRSRFVAFVALRSLPGVRSASSPPPPHRRVTWPLAPAYPPCEQWLAGLGRVLGRTSSSVLHAAHFHPARSCSRRGLGCCGGCPSVSCVSSAGGGYDVAGGAYPWFKRACVASSLRRFVVRCFETNLKI